MEELYSKELLSLCDLFCSTLKTRFNHQQSLLKLLSCSDFALEHFKKNPKFFRVIIEDSKLEQPRTQADYQKALSYFSNLSEAEYLRALRHYRYQEMIRIAWRAIGLRAKLEITLEEISALADACILNALSYAQHELNQRYKTPQDKYGELQKLYVIAVGKLGGRELNFSSDVDLYFVFPEETNISDSAALPASFFFNSVAKKLVKLLSTVTKDGFVFRVDLRLRPNGQSGAVAISFKTMETYYQEQGRDWERYAMVKARVINPKDLYTLKLVNILTPFVYRRYIDFSVLESLRSLKLIIQREIQVQHLQDDIKRGTGGIREIEFICQSMQLIRGGREPILRTSNIFEALKQLKRLESLSNQEATILQDAYVFFRLLENAIQIQHDQQQHALPESSKEMQQIITMLNFNDLLTFKKTLDKHRQSVSNIFEGMLNVKEFDYQNDQRIVETQLINLCHGKLGDVPSENLLLSLGFRKPNNAFSQISNLFSSARYKRLSQIAKLRLEKFLPILLLTLSSHDNIDEIFLRTIQLLESILKRSTYLALLTENPTAIQHLLKLFSLSSWIAHRVIEHPFLLEVLLDEKNLYKPLSEEVLEQSLVVNLNQYTDLEHKVEQLKQFKLMQQLRVASAFITKQLPVYRLAMHLSRTAKVILQQVLKIAKYQLLQKDPTLKASLDKFIIIAYGKLGSEELGLNSDLDLVFLHECSVDEEIIITRLTRKILHILNSRTMGGVLYAIDTRLRPSGSAGLLVSHIKAFEEYQLTKAWLWEHQALIKARCLAGSNKLAEKFDSIRKNVLIRARQIESLSQEITTMRKKMKHQITKESIRNIKQVDYGLIDLEFLSQFFILAFASVHSELYKCHGVYQMIIAMQKLNIISKLECDELVSYFDYLNEQLNKELLLTNKEQEISIQPPKVFSKLLLNWALDF